jgi:hypothetical protein
MEKARGSRLVSRFTCFTLQDLQEEERESSPYATLLFGVYTPLLL